MNVDKSNMRIVHRDRNFENNETRMDSKFFYH